LTRWAPRSRDRGARVLWKGRREVGIDMSGRKHGLLSFAAAAVLAVGCAHGNTATAADEAGEPEALLQVSNQNWSDMNVYLVRGAMKQRLGTVSSNTTSRFKLPRHIFASPDPVQLLADPIGSARTYTSPPLLVNPGQTVEWRLENNVALSSFLVR